jgi:signal transduction histidine kinase
MRSLGARLFAAAILFVTIALVITWLALTQLFSDFVAQEYERELQAVSDTLVANLNVKDRKLALRREPNDPRFEIAAGGRYWQVDGPSAFSKRSRSLWDTKIVTTGKAISLSPLMLADGPSGDQLLVLVQEVTLEKDGLDYRAAVFVAADYAEYAGALSDFQSQIFNMLLLTGLFLLAAAALQILVGLRPLFDVRKDVAALRHGHLSHIDRIAPQEVLPLISEINTLMANNRSALERARARASDLAHGLKTPLTVLGQISEALSNKGDKANARIMEEQVSTIRSRVDRQLALARTGNPSNSSLDAAATLDRLIKATKPLLDANKIAIKSLLPSGFSIAADATDFLEATGNVLDNAVRHARGHISISAKKLGAVICITISDDGPGIPEAKRNAALERGRRLDESGEGTGLGLAISSEILSAYGGSISLGVSDMGGLAVNMDWPTRTGT